MAKVKIKFPCGWEEERDEWGVYTYVLARTIREAHKKYCKDCKKVNK